jgi:nucleoid-associated protein YgaU
MKKGQRSSKRIKNILKFLKMNENTISTLMGGMVIIVIAGLIFNYFRTANLKTWQGILLNEQETASTEMKDDSLNDKIMATYKVVKGDDLWHISEKYYKSGYNYVDIMQENNLTGKGVIVADMELRIPKVEAKKATVVESAKEMTISDNGDLVKTDSVESANATSIETGEYLIQKGDSYWKIAVRAYGDGYKWTKIYWANKNLFADPDMIFTGVKITIPVLEK